jgi:CelD/BcsL family acetyltransferase involved in cellulose biosynthesis
MAASYHADYATILADPRDLAIVGEAVASMLEGGAIDGDSPVAWDCVDLRRLRYDDPLLDHLQAPLERRARAAGWEVRRDLEDVCPVVPLADDWEAQLASLGKKTRHEVRRKLRRAEGAGNLTLRYLPLEAESVERFVMLHQARWGADGLFPATEGGDRSRLFLHRLVELEAADGRAAQLHLGEVLAGDRVLHAFVGFDDGRTCHFYNAGMDPSARDLSPGVVGTAMYLRDRLEAGTRRFDFLRGDEAYKYEWGAVDEPIFRILVHRTVDR